jgi:ABC-type transport system substrate-binding protein
MFMETYTEELMASLVYDTLYAWTLNYTDEQWLTAGIVEPDPWEYIMRPDLASALPTYLDGGTRVRVPLKDNVTWSDGVPFNATDVKYTFDLTLNSATKNSGEGDFSYIMESVEYVPGTATDPYTGLDNIDAFTVDFILKEPLPDIVSVLSNDWGGSIMPWHSLKHLAPGDMRDDEVSTDWTKMVPGTGSHNVTNYILDESITLERNDLYWGYDLGWGPHVSTVILKWVPDAKTRMAELQTNTVDFGEYPTATVDEYYDLMNATNVRVFQYDYPASNGVWFNLDNEYMSNRYVRQAIAHAIPYETIFTEVFPSWGIETAYRAISHILPNNHYTDPDTGERVQLFNDDLDPVVYDPIIAQMYLDMYLYSKVGTDYTLGPVGDADFSGLVDFDDWFVWFDNYGKTDGGINAWPWIPGCDIDPDFNNDNATTMADFDLWWPNYGEEYPFPGAL